MHRLAGSDAGFLFIETLAQTSVCVDLVELAEPVPGVAPLSVHSLYKWFEDHLAVLEPLRWRLEQVPLQIHHPLWIEDPDFDLSYHIREHTLPSPGGRDEIEAFHAACMPEVLDLRHPLWRVTLVNGLDNGRRQALLFQIHHSLADGAVILHTFTKLFHPLPQGVDPTTRAPASPPPRRSKIFTQALKDQARAWKDIPAMYRETKQRFAAADARREEGHVPVPKSMGDAPATVLNRPGPIRRTCAHTTVPIEDLQQVRSNVGCTLNDVALAMVGGGLRRYLGERDQLPTKSLVANVPVSGDPPGTQPRSWGNRFANFFVFLATDIEDPCERLSAIAAGTAEAKVLLETQGHFTLTEWLERIPPFIGARAARWMIDRNAKDTEKSGYNVLISNVRFMDDDLAICEIPVEAIHLTGPIGDDAGLNITVVGYKGTLHITIDASPVAVDDPRSLIEDIAQSLKELLACTA